jgi:hypothetical protein
MIGRYKLEKITLMATHLTWTSTDHQVAALANLSRFHRVCRGSTCIRMLKLQVGLMHSVCHCTALSLKSVNGVQRERPFSRVCIGARELGSLEHLVVTGIRNSLCSAVRCPEALCSLSRSFLEHATDALMFVPRAQLDSGVNAKCVGFLASDSQQTCDLSGVVD